MTKITRNIEECIAEFLTGNLVIYPAEAVYGLGCMIDKKNAISRIRYIKEREVNQGLIVLSDSWESVSHLIEGAERHQNDDFVCNWPDNTTAVFCASNFAPEGLCVDGHNGLSIAIRITQDKFLKQLCQQVGPLVSTSANLRNMPPPTSFDSINPELIKQIELVYVNDNFSHNQPSKIIDFYSKKVLR